MFSFKKERTIQVCTSINTKLAKYRVFVQASTRGILAGAEEMLHHELLTRPTSHFLTQTRLVGAHVSPYRPRAYTPASWAALSIQVLILS